jgi:hypothetical protein
MRIVGEWLLADDGVTRPVVEADVQAAEGDLLRERFLVDSGADRTVFSESLLSKRGFPASPAPANLVLEGVGGESGFVVVRTVIVLPCDDGRVANMRGEFAAFTDPTSAELSILGREVLNNFDLILSYPRKEVLLLAKNHYYRVERA